MAMPTPFVPIQHPLLFKSLNTINSEWTQVFRPNFPSVECSADATARLHTTQTNLTDQPQPMAQKGKAIQQSTQPDQLFAIIVQDNSRHNFPLLCTLTTSMHHTVYGTRGTAVQTIQHTALTCALESRAQRSQVSRTGW